jgi:hypothetical protein
MPRYTKVEHSPFPRDTLVSLLVSGRTMIKQDIELIRSYMSAQRSAMVTLLERLALTESPTHDPAAIQRILHLIRD